MFEGLIAELLNKYLGQFVENVSSKDLSASVWSGEVNLVDLQVKSSGLDFLKLPVQVIKGYIGKLHLKANWRSLGSQPVQVELRDVFVLAGPRQEHADALDSQEILRAALENKLNTLALQESTMIQEEEERLQQKKKKPGDEDGEGYTARLIAKIIDNVQIRIRNIHIRYQDHTDSQSPLALGFALEELSAITTDSDWKSTKFVAGQDARQVFKLLNLSNLLVYLNTDPKHRNSGPITKVRQLGDLFDTVMQRQTPGNAHDRFRDLEYILKPLKGQLRLKSDKDWKLNDTQQFDVQASLDVIHLGISRHQYVKLLRVSSSMSGFTSIHSLGLDTESKSLFRAATRQEQKRYVTLYKRTLNATWEPPLSTEEGAEIQRLEREIEFTDLAKGRRAAVLELRRQLPQGQFVTRREIAERKNAGGWFTRRVEVKPVRFLSDREREELYASLDIKEGVLEAAAENDLPPDTVTMKIAFELKGVMLSLYRGKDDLFASLANGRTVTRVRVYPKSLWVELAVDNVHMEDRATPNTLFRQLISSPSTLVESKEELLLPGDGGSAAGAAPSAIAASAAGDRPPFLRLVYEQNPLDREDLDSKVQLTVQQRQIVLHVPFLKSIVDLVSPPQDVDVLALYSWSQSQLEQLQRRTKASLAERLAVHSRNDISVSVIAPLVVFAKDPTDPTADVVVLDLGKLDLTTQLQPKEQMDAVLKLLTEQQKDAQADPTIPLLSPENQSKCYDRFDIQLRNMRLFLAPDGPNWSEHETVRRNIGLGGLEPVDLNVILCTSVAPDVLWLPSLKIEGDLPLVSLRLATTQYHRIMSFLRSAAEDWSADGHDHRLITHPGGDGGEGEEEDARTKIWNWALSSSSGPSPLDGLMSGGSDDEDEDGSADYKVIQAASQSHSLHLDDLTKILGSRARAEEVMKEMDVSGEGEVSVSELREWWKRHKESLKHDRFMVLDFRLREVRVIVSDDLTTHHRSLEEEESPYGQEMLAASLNGIQVSLHNRTFDTEFSASLQSLLVEDRTPETLDIHDEPLAVINTAIVDPKALGWSAEDQNLSDPQKKKLPPGFVVVSLKYLDPSSPDLDVEGSIQHQIEVDIGRIVATVEGSSLLRLARFTLEDLLQDPDSSPGMLAAVAAAAPIAVSAAGEEEEEEESKSETNTPKPSIGASPPLSPVPKAVSADESKDEAADAAPEEAKQQNPKTHKSSTRTPRAEALARKIGLHVTVRMAKVAALVLHGSQAIARADVDGFSTEIVQRPFDLDVSVILRAISLRDMTPAGVHNPFIIQSGTNFPSSAAAPVASPAAAAAAAGEHPEAKDALVTVLFGNRHQLSPKYRERHVELSTRVRGIRVVLLMRFLSELTEYMQTESVLALLNLFSGDEETTAAAAAEQQKERRQSLLSSESGAVLQSAVGKTDQAAASIAQLIADVPKITATLSEVEVVLPRHSSSLARTIAFLPSVRVTNHVFPDKSVEDGRDLVYQQWAVDLSEMRVFTKGSHPSRIISRRGSSSSAASPAAVGRRRRRRSSASMNHFTPLGSIEAGQDPRDDGSVASLRQQYQYSEADSDVQRLLFEALPSRITVDLKSHVETMILDVKLGALNLSLSHWQYSLLMNTLSGNLAESAVIVAGAARSAAAAALAARRRAAELRVAVPEQDLQPGAAEDEEEEEEEDVIAVERRSVMQIRAQLPLISAILLQDKGEHLTREGLIRAKIKRLHLSLDQTVDSVTDQYGLPLRSPLRSLKLEASVEAMGVDDICEESSELAGRPVLSAYRRLLYAPPSRSGNPSLSFRMEQEPEDGTPGPQNVDIVLNAVSFNIGSDIVLRSLSSFAEVQPVEDPISVEVAVASHLQEEEEGEEMEGGTTLTGDRIHSGGDDDDERKQDTRSSSTRHRALTTTPASSADAGGGAGGGGGGGGLDGGDGEEPPVPMHVSVRLKQVSVQVFMDPTSPATTAVSLVLESDTRLYSATLPRPAGTESVDFPHDTLAATSELNNLCLLQRRVQVLQGRLNMLEADQDLHSSAVIIEPMNVRADFRLSPSHLLPTQSKLYVDVSMDRLNMRLAVTSIANINNIMTVLTAAAETAQKRAEAESNRGLEEMDQRFGVRPLTAEGMSASVLEEEADLEQLGKAASHRRKSLVMATSGGSSSSSSTGGGGDGSGQQQQQHPGSSVAGTDGRGGGGGEKFPSFGEQSIEIHFGGVSVLLLNDYHHSRQAMERVLRRARTEKDAPAVVPAPDTMVMPVARVLVEETTCRVAGFEHERSLTMSTFLSAYFYNHFVLGWEPILEPTQVQLRTTSSLTSLVPADNTVLELAIPKPMEVNISEAMVRGIEGTLQLLSLASEQQKLHNPSTAALLRVQEQRRPEMMDDDSSGDGEQKSAPLSDLGIIPPQSSSSSGSPSAAEEEEEEEDGGSGEAEESAMPYRLRNFTEFEVRVALLAEPNPELSEEDQYEMFDVPAGGNIGFRLPMEEAVNEDSQFPGQGMDTSRQSALADLNGSVARVSLKQNYGWSKIPVDLRRVSVVSWDLRSASHMTRGIPFKTTLVVQVEDNGFGVKLVTLHSQLAVHNTLPVPIALTAAASEDPSRMHWTVPPNGTRYMPLMSTAASQQQGQVSGAKLCFRPLQPGAVDPSASVYQPTREVLLVHKQVIQRRPAPLTLYCGPAGGAEEASFALCVQRDRHSTGHFTTFILSSPIRLENLLPAPICVRVLERRGRRKGKELLLSKTRQIVDQRTVTSGQVYPITNLSLGTGSDAPHLFQHLQDKNDGGGGGSGGGGDRNVELLMSLSIPELELGWCSVVPVRFPAEWQPSPGASSSSAPQQFLQQALFTTRDRHRQLRVYFETVFHPSGVTISVWVPFWFLDLTDLRLQLSADSKTFLPQRGMIEPPVAAAAVAPPPEGRGEDEEDRLEGRRDDAGGRRIVKPIMLSFPRQEMEKDGTVWLALQQQQQQQQEEQEEELYWSQPFSVATGTGTNQIVTIRTTPPQQQHQQQQQQQPQSAGQQPPALLRTYELTAEIASLPDSRFHRTKILKVAPRVLMQNKTPFPLVVRQFGSPLGARFARLMQTDLAPGEQKPYIWPCPIDGSRSLGTAGSATRPLIHVRRGKVTDVYVTDREKAPDGAEICEWDWSGFVNIHSAKSTLLSIRNRFREERWYLQMDVRLNKSTGSLFVIFETLKPERLEWYLPYLIENKTVNRIIRFRQLVPPGSTIHDPELRVAATAENRSPDPSPWITLRPFTSVLYTWDEPSLITEPSSRQLEFQVGTTCLSDRESVLEFGLQFRGKLSLDRMHSSAMHLNTTEHPTVEQWLGSPGPWNSGGRGSSDGSGGGGGGEDGNGGGGRVFVTRRHERSTDTTVVTVCDYSLPEVEPLQTDMSTPTGGAGAGAGRQQEDQVRNLFHLRAEHQRRADEEMKMMRSLKLHCENVVLLSEQRLRQESQRLAVVRAAEQTVSRPEKAAPFQSELSVLVVDGSGFRSNAYYYCRIDFAERPTVRSDKGRGEKPVWNRAARYDVSWFRQKVEASLLRITVWQPGVFSDTCVGGVTVPLGKLAGHVPVAKPLPLRRLTPSDELIPGSLIRVRLWWVAPQSVVLESFLRSFNAYTLEQQRVFRSLRSHERWLKIHTGQRIQQAFSGSQPGTTTTTAATTAAAAAAGMDPFLDSKSSPGQRSLTEGVPDWGRKFIGTPVAEFSLRLQSVKGLKGLADLVQRFPNPDGRSFDLQEPGSRVVCVVDCPLIRRKAHFVLFDALVDADMDNRSRNLLGLRERDSSSSSSRGDQGRLGNTEAFRGNPPSIVRHGERLLEDGLLHQIRKRLDISPNDGGGGEEILYHALNSAAHRTEKDALRNCVILTTKRFLKIHKGRIVTNLDLTQLARVEYRKNNVFRYDKLYFVLADGTRDETGVFSSDAAKFFHRVLQSRITDRARSQLAAVELQRRLQLREQQRKRNGSRSSGGGGDEEKKTQGDGGGDDGGDLDLTLDSLLMWDQELRFHVPELLLQEAGQPCEVSLSFYYLPADSLRSRYSSGGGGERDGDDDGDDDDGSDGEEAKERSTTQATKLLQELLSQESRPVRLGDALIDLRRVPRIPEDPNGVKPGVLKQRRAEAEKWIGRWFRVRLDPRLIRGYRRSLDGAAGGGGGGGGGNPPELLFSASLTNTRAVSMEQRPQLSVELSATRLGVSLIDREPQELLYFSAHGLTVGYKESTTQRTLEMVLEHLQLDNQQEKAFFPVILAPTPMAETHRQPFFQVAMNLAMDERLPENTVYVNYLSVLLQKMDLKIEEALLYQVQSLFSSLTTATTTTTTAATVTASSSHPLEEEKSSLERRHSDSGSSSSSDSRSGRRDGDRSPLERSLIWCPEQEFQAPVSQESLLVFQWLHLQPVAARLHFEPDRKARDVGFGIQSNVLSSIAGFFTVLVGSLETSLQLPSLGPVQGLQMSPSAFTDFITEHYRAGALSQLNRVIFNPKFLGKPLDLVENIGSGVVGVFYEPHEGIVHSPEMFGRGLTRLFRTTWSSVFHSLSAISGTVGSGISTLTMDESFIEQDRERNRAQNAPEHVGKGLASGVKSLGTGIVMGVTGIVRDPIRGAKRGGAKGMIKGFGKGLVGVVTKPTAGAVGLVSQSLQGLGNTPGYLMDDTLTNQRVRPQRRIDPDRPLVAYSRHAEQR